MYRFALALVLSTPLCAFAACNVSGTAYDSGGKPMPTVVRLVDLQTQQAEFAATDAHAAFAFSGAGGGHYRLDVLSAPTVVTGTHFATRSILGMSDNFACCGGQLAHQDVRAQVD